MTTCTHSWNWRDPGHFGSCPACENTNSERSQVRHVSPAVAEVAEQSRMRDEINRLAVDNRELRALIANGSPALAEVVRLRTQVAELAAALFKLTNECAGLCAFERELRVAIGNTNTSILIERTNEARAALAKVRP